ncbi:hypothetical protein CVT26_005061 [Gymnopilus dilepis]|uniref:Uncharacterized protein n=1 Tax=Gymnopilus dilepis TaxID=231916 RepID=A0A409Y0A2_9AGAR|nr:hypothetical protein CVT26_005061 [Gymnopilus dilepis]
MYLINVNTLQLCKIQRLDNNYSYAILSHTWADDEVTFQEFTKETGKKSFSKESLNENPRYSKIVRCCAEAELRGFKYAWIDTCCIDKTSSSELSEAINSMYQWYKGASVCYAYLSDVDSDRGVPDMESFKNCRWFTRGWTLQELIAPLRVIFFDCDWNDIGTKLSLREEISKITGVPVTLLTGFHDAPLDSFCIAQRMSWAANRETTRVEDIAYCLMGIFDVNMPILYGEGQKAFIRLQEEILKRSDDESLFAWVAPFRHGGSFEGHLLPPQNFPAQTSRSSVLAPSPDCFKYGKFVRRTDAAGSQASPFSVTNNGLHISLPLITTEETLTVRMRLSKYKKALEESTVLLAVLGCQIIGEENPLAIILVKQSSDRYFRVAAEYLCRASLGREQNGRKLLSKPKRTELYIDTPISYSSGNRLESSMTSLSSVELMTVNCDVVECGDAWYNVTAIFALTIRSRRTGLGNAMVVLSRGCDDDWICCWAYQPRSSAPFPQALWEWWTNHEDRLQQSTLESIGTDRTSLQLPSGDKITVSVDIGVDSQYSVVIQLTDRLPTHSRKQPRHLVSSEQQKQDLRAYREKQKRYKEDWGETSSGVGWIIFSKEVSRLPQDKKHHDIRLE